jgi:hypothetical protein
MLESYKWISEIIDSCENRFQIDCCNNLIDLFKKMYTHKEGINELYDNLLGKMIVKDISLA